MPLPFAPVATLPSSLHGVGAVLIASHPTLPIIATCGPSKVIHIHNLEIPERPTTLNQILPPTPPPVTSLSYSASGVLVALQQSTTTVLLHSSGTTASSGTTTSLDTFTKDLTAASLNAAATLLAVGTSKGAVLVFNVATRKRIACVELAKVKANSMTKLGLKVLSVAICPESSPESYEILVTYGENAVAVVKYSIGGAGTTSTPVVTPVVTGGPVVTNGAVYSPTATLLDPSYHFTTPSTLTVTTSNATSKGGMSIAFPSQYGAIISSTVRGENEIAVLFKSHVVNLTRSDTSSPYVEQSTFPFADADVLDSHVLDSHVPDSGVLDLLGTPTTLTVTPTLTMAGSRSAICVIALTKKATTKTTKIATKKVTNKATHTIQLYTPDLPICMLAPLTLELSNTVVLSTTAGTVEILAVTEQEDGFVKGIQDEVVAIGRGGTGVTQIVFWTGCAMSLLMYWVCVK